MTEMISYSTNWMGPINTKWIEENGNDWATGRIDVSGDVPEYTEINLPMMKGDDWNRFSAWLDNFTTPYRIWSLDEIVEEYETTNPKITWWKK